MKGQRKENRVERSGGCKYCPEFPNHPVCSQLPLHYHPRIAMSRAYSCTTTANMRLGIKMGKRYLVSFVLLFLSERREIGKEARPSASYEISKFDRKKRLEQKEETRKISGALYEGR